MTTQSEHLVEAIMHKGVIGCKPSTSLEEVIRIMADTNVEVLVVTGPDEEALGIISQLDVLPFYGQDLKGKKARDVMSQRGDRRPPDDALAGGGQHHGRTRHQRPDCQRPRRCGAAGARRPDHRPRDQGDARQQVDVVFQPGAVT